MQLLGGRWMSLILFGRAYSAASYGTRQHHARQEKVPVVGSVWLP